MVFTFKFLLPKIIMMCCVLYYLVINAQAFKRDQLTGILNRRSFFVDAKRSNKKNYIIISIDLNSLKKINDTDGHLAGDKALIVFAETVMSVTNTQFRFYRTGGNEFVVIAKEQQTDAVEKFIIAAKNALSKTPYMASFGYAIHNANDDFYDVFQKADIKMYEDKQRFRHR